MNPNALAEKMGEQHDSTDLALFVRTSSEEMVKWDKQYIIDALIRETNVNPDMANIIGVEVEKQIRSLNIEVITSPLIRELVDVKLLEYGLEDARRKHTRLGAPLYDVKNIIFNQNKENANVPHGPEATNLTLAENIKKEFALLNVFSTDISNSLFDILV